MPLAWHPTRWWDWCMPQDEKMKKKKEIEPFFVNKNKCKVSNIAQLLNFAMVYCIRRATNFWNY